MVVFVHAPFSLFFPWLFSLDNRVMIKIHSTRSTLYRSLQITGGRLPSLEQSWGSAFLQAAAMQNNLIVVNQVTNGWGLPAGEKLIWEHANWKPWTTFPLCIPLSHSTPHFTGIYSMHSICMGWLAERRSASMYPPGCSVYVRGRVMVMLVGSHCQLVANRHGYHTNKTNVLPNKVK